MARPKKTQEGPSAVERMEQAFWDLLEEKPYSKITVGEVVKRAQVNRNAFYYHFDNLDELANYALENVIPYELYGQLFAVDQSDSTPIREFAQDEEMLNRTSKLRIAVGKHGSGELLAKTQKMAAEAVLQRNNLVEEDLTKEELLTIKFVMGGITAVANANLGNEHPLPLLLKTRLVPPVYEVLFSTLKGAQERKEKKASAL